MHSSKAHDDPGRKSQPCPRDPANFRVRRAVRHLVVPLLLSSDITSTRDSFSPRCVFSPFSLRFHWNNKVLTPCVRLRSAIENIVASLKPVLNAAIINGSFERSCEIIVDLMSCSAERWNVPFESVLGKGGKDGFSWEWFWSI